MTAAGARLDLGDRTEARRLGALRQPWQTDAWTYRRNLGELRYATAYLGNSAMRMRLFPGAYAEGNELPVPAEEADAGLPAGLIADATDALERLADGGPKALRQMQKRIVENFEVAGECCLIGETDSTNNETWSIRSTSEMVYRDGRVGYRTSPVVGSAGTTDQGVTWLSEERSYVTRLWTPDPEWGQLADSPVRAVLDVLEELLLLGKDVRATARARLANNGILKWPSNLEIVPPQGVDIGENDDVVLATFYQAATSALLDEGSASAVLPIIVKGDPEALQHLDHLAIKREESSRGIDKRQELIGRLAIGIDLPAEVLTGKTDLNHWSAWAVDDDSFRHHIEPIVISLVDALTVGYLWTDLAARGWRADQYRQIVIWYDPTELVTHPDRSKDAFEAWDRMALSDEALLGYLGFPDTDRPETNELLFRLMTKMRSMDPAIQSEILRRVDPTLPIAVAPAAPAPPGAEPPPEPPSPPDEGPPPEGPADEPPAPSGPPAAAVAGASPPPREIPRDAARKLIDIDRALRERLRTAADATLRRALEKAGARIVSKARTASGATVRDAIRNVPLAAVPATVGPAIVASMGVDPAALADEEFAALQRQWDTWVRTGQETALRQAASIAGLDVNTAYGQLAGSLATDRAAGWALLAGAMQDRLHELLTTSPTEADVTATARAVIDGGEMLLSTGPVRAALAVAGGYASRIDSAGIGSDYRPVDPSDPMGGVGTGPYVSDLLEGAGITVEAYQWVHGMAERPFPEHLDLDGAILSDFEDPAVSVNVPEWIGATSFFPGDHAGCSCDLLPILVPATIDSAGAPETVGADTGGDGE